MLPISLTKPFWHAAVVPAYRSPLTAHQRKSILGSLIRPQRYGGGGWHMRCTSPVDDPAPASPFWRGPGAVGRNEV